MATFAIILDNKVINIIDAPSLEVAQEATGKTCIEYTDSNPAGIGWTWDGTNFVPPVVEEISEEEVPA
jgi:hypothetical protein